MRIAIIRRETGNALSMDVYAENLVAQLRKVRPEWSIIEVAPKPWSSSPANSWDTANPVRKYYERFWNYPRLVSKHNVDLFHIIDQTDGHIAYWLKKLGKPVIVTCHDLVQYVYPEILQDQARLPALSLATWRYSVTGMTIADRVIAVSSNTAHDVTKMLDIAPDKVTVVPNGVDSQFRVISEHRCQTRRQQYTSSTKEICLLNVGSSHQRKNIATILKTLFILRDQKLPVRLWKIGSDFTPEQKAYISDRQLQSQITWIGQPNRETLIELYNAADILLAPSLYEGFGLTILEAMACGTPVITSNVSSLPEVVGNAGILVDDPLNEHELAASILRLAQEPESREYLIEQGLKRVQQYTWLKTAEKVSRVYESCLSKKCLAVPSSS